MPVRSLSVLKPGQTFTVFLQGFEKLNEQAFDITASWLRKPRSDERESYSYTLDLRSDYDGWGQLGGGPPLVEIAKEIRKIRESISKIERR